MIVSRVRRWFLCGLVFCASAAAQQGSVPAFRNPDLPVEQRVADLVARMTLEEKVLQMQNSAPAILRLGIPQYDWWNEALHGVARAGRATVFPQAIGMAATWDTELMHRVAGIISTEARAKYNEAQRVGDYSRYHGLTFWSPNINIFRDPRWGRGQETYGEDPFLTARMAVAFIRGLQGDDPRYFKTIATAKHFAVHSGPEPSRHSFDVHPSPRDLEETYLPAFRASIEEGKADSIMCAYNRVDGLPACANTDLLQKHLRLRWNFQGYVVSDCGAIYDFVHGHKYRASMAEASALAVQAGTDLTCGDEYASLVEAVHRGLISEAEIDSALRRLFTARFRLGMFDPPERVPFTKISYAEVDSEEHRQVALEAARKAIVLLKNDRHMLPLKGNLGRIAVIGPAADDVDTELANYHGISSRIVTPLEGMRRQFGAERIHFAQGSTFSIGSKALIPAEALIPPEGVPVDASKSAARGLLAEYFGNDQLEGQAQVTRIESRIYLQREMEDKEVDAKIPRNHFSVRWRGRLRAPYSGEYKLSAVRMRCEDCKRGDSIQVYLDEKLVINEGADGTPEMPEATIALRKEQEYGLRVEYRQRSGGVGVQLVWQPPVDPLLEEAKKTVESCDLAVAFLGLNSQLEGEEMKIAIPGFSGGDRTTLDLPEPQERLLEEAVQTGKPVVLVLLSGSAVATEYATKHAAAILEAWYGGEEGGTAIAQTLAGENNPAGRLPVTFYRSVNQLPPFEDYAMRGRTYRYFGGDPEYGFGYGLSYSTFHYSNLQVQPRSGTGGGIHVRVRVKNNSDIEGDEVAQVYVSRKGRGDADPIRELRGFQRIHLGPGEEREIEFEVKPEQGESYASTGKQFVVSVGGGQPALGVDSVQATF